MSRSPLLMSSPRRRRSRLAAGRVLALALVALAALAGAGVGGFALLRGPSGGSSGPRLALAAPPSPAPPALQPANGPKPTGPQPLAVRLGDPRDPVRLRLAHPPRSGLLFDLDTGRVLWRHHAERVLPIASLTKMMTALIVAQHDPAADKVLITKQAVDYQGSGMGVLKKGKRVRLETLLYGLLLPSGNDAAIALAQHEAGDVPAFVAQMNGQAQAMGLRCTHYTSPSGFVDKGNHSCVADLAAEARAILDVPRLARIVRARKAILPFPIKGKRVFLYNNNPLLLERYPGTLGVKTGFTGAAGICLVAAAERHGHRLGVVLLHSPNTAEQGRKLLDAGFKFLHAR